MTGSVWFTSDLHLGHRLVSGHRGFADLEDHDEAILGNWRKLVRPVDRVWVLGDLSLVASQVRVHEMLEKIKALPGQKILIPGNHDPVHPMHRDAFKWQRLYLTAFEAVMPYARLKLNGQTVLLSHMPYSADRGPETRYPQWRLPDLGDVLLHGHTHSATKALNREIHVGLDAWSLKPVRQDQVLALIQAAR